MRRFASPACSIAILAAWCAWTGAAAQGSAQIRLPRDVFDVVPPSAHVRGAPGTMMVQPQECRTLPAQQARRRIVDVAAQEWAFFGFRVVDQTVIVPDRTREAFAGGTRSPNDGRRGRRRPRMAPEEASRVASSIAGYWAVTPEGSWIVSRQNDEWKGPDGIASRWNAPWSAAFISWVMCEGGAGTAGQFRRAVAHHTYIDQAIRARDGRAPEAAFAAYDIGETELAPGDLLCSSRQPAYRSIAERRRQLGVGARSHCDIVVAVDGQRGRILAIGGNVRGTVSLKLIGAERAAGRPLHPRGAGDETRPFFAHLKMRAEPIEANAIDSTPTLRTFGCEVARRAPLLLAAAAAGAAHLTSDRC